MDPVLEKTWNDVRSRLLFPRQDVHPYYIVAPRWIYRSAGVRALHLLCHALNLSGQRAFLIHYPFEKKARNWLNQELYTPVLDASLAQAHFEAGRSPIVVYPEVVSGNPLEAPVVARWVLNFPGLLGGDRAYDLAELCFGYSHELADAAGCSGQVLHMPTIDTRLFHPPAEEAERRGGCFFASKYKGERNPITEGCFEITRGKPDSLEPAAVAELLRRSEVFYAYENTALVVEAVLCGCPAVFLPNTHLTAMIGQGELGTDGIAWGSSPEARKQAQATVAQGAINYLKTYDRFWDQLAGFVDKTQVRASDVSYDSMIRLPIWSSGFVRQQAHRLQKELKRCFRRIQGRF